VDIFELAHEKYQLEELMYCSRLSPSRHIYISQFFVFGDPYSSSTVNLPTSLTTVNIVPFKFRFVAMPYLSRVLVHKHVF